MSLYLRQKVRKQPAEPRRFYLPAQSLTGQLTAYAPPNISGQIGDHHKAFLQRFPAGVGLTRNALAEFNRDMRARYMAGDMAVASVVYKPISRQEAFKLLALASNGDKAWVANVLQNAGSWGLKYKYAKGPDGRTARSAETGQPIVVDRTVRVTEKGLMMTHARQGITPSRVYSEGATGPLQVYTPPQWRLQ